MGSLRVVKGKRISAIVHPPAKHLQLSSVGRGVLSIGKAQNGSVVLENITNLQEAETSVERADLSFVLIEFQADLLTEADDRVPALNEMLFVVMDEIAIVHVAGIIANMKLLLDEVIQAAQGRQRTDLGDLGAESEPHIPELGDEILDEIAKTLIEDGLVQDFIHQLVRDAVKEPVDVKYKDVAFGAMLDPVFPEMHNDPIPGEGNALILERSAVVMDEGAGEEGNQAVIAGAALNHALADVDGANVPLLAPFKDVERIETSASKGSVLQAQISDADIEHRICPIELGGFLPSNALAALLVGTIEMRECEHLIEGTEFVSLGFLCLALGSASFVARFMSLRAGHCKTGTSGTVIL